MIGLSKSTLSVFKECPRCFWMAKVGKLDRPRSPMPGIVNAMDAVMKAAIEEYITVQVPIPYLEGNLHVPFPDRAQLKSYRSWRTFQTTVKAGGFPVKIWGELDDLLVMPDGRVSVWDFKSRGEAPPEGYSEKWYELDADIYDLLLAGNGHATTGLAYFTYVWPIKIEGDVLVLGHATTQMESNRQRGLDLLAGAAACLEMESPPKANPGCGTCSYIEMRAEWDRPTLVKAGAGRGK